MKNKLFIAVAAVMLIATACDKSSDPEITITMQPAANSTYYWGEQSVSLSVEASVTLGATLSYQWYSNTSNSSTGGTPVSGATNASYTIPTTLDEGIYYYFCEVSATGSATSVRSNVAKVTVVTGVG